MEIWGRGICDRRKNEGGGGLSQKGGDISARRGVGDLGREEGRKEEGDM